MEVMSAFIPQYPLYIRVAGCQRRSGRFEEGVNPLLLPEIKTSVIQHLHNSVLTLVSSLILYANEVYSRECPIKEDLPNWRWTYGLLHLSTRTVRHETSSSPVMEHGGSCSTNWMVENILSNTSTNSFINILKLRSVIWEEQKYSTARR